MTEIIPLQVVVAPANVAGSEVRSEFRPTPRPGVIRQVMLQFPTGCNGTIHARLLSREGQVAPISGTDFALGGGPPLIIPGLNIPVGDNNPALRLEAWADAGNTYSHRIDVIVTVEHVGGL